MSTPLALSLIILFAPAAGAVLLTFFGERLPRKGDWLAVGSLGAAFAAAIALFTGVFDSGPSVLHYSAEWIRLTPAAGEAPRVMRMGFLLDNLTRTMLLVVAGVSFFVHLFSTGYMRGDVRYLRYFTYLQLFTFSMNGLVLADNLLMLYIFWELVGLSSYLLIGHYFEKMSAARACMKAFITTRIGDVGMFLGILIIWAQTGSLDYATVFAAANPLAPGADDILRQAAAGTLDGVWKTLAGLGIFFGAMGKSAQFPLHVWLPDAMEGPTPVSAMIHAATMVAAGVYLVGRVFPIFDPLVLVIIAIIGGVTAVFAATIALVQDDIKRVLAYSTVSQLGYMMLGLGAGSFVGGLFHMTTHAAFKALLFLGSGSVIHAMHHEQSMSRYGGLRKKIPITFWTFLTATLAISGLPYITSGFYSKDMIIAKTLEAGMNNLNQAGRLYYILFGAAVLTAAMTAFYMFRAVFLTFFGKPKDHHLYEHAHESPWNMTVPLMALAVCSVIAGGFSLSGSTWFEKHINTNNELYSRYFPAEIHGETGGEAAHESAASAHEALSSAQAPASHSSLSSHPSHSSHNAHTAHIITVYATIAAFIIGLSLAWLLYIKRAIDPAEIARFFAPVHRLLLAKWYVDEFYATAFIRPVHIIAAVLRWFDQNVLDFLVNLSGWLTAGVSWLSGLFDHIVVDGAVNLLGKETKIVGYMLGVFQTGRVRHYLLYSVTGACTAAIVFYVIYA